MTGLIKFAYPPVDHSTSKHQYASFEDYMTRYDPDGLTKWVDQRLHGSPQLVDQPTSQGWSTLTDETLEVIAAQVRAVLYEAMDKALHRIDPLIDLKPLWDDDDE